MKRFQIGWDPDVWKVYDEVKMQFVFSGTQDECIDWLTDNYPNEGYVIFDQKSNVTAEQAPKSKIKVHIVTLNDTRGVHLRAGAPPGVLHQAIADALKPYQDGDADVMAIQLLPPVSGVVSTGPFFGEAIDEGRWMAAITFK